MTTTATVMPLTLLRGTAFLYHKNVSLARFVFVWGLDGVMVLDGNRDSPIAMCELLVGLGAVTVLVVTATCEKLRVTIATRAP